MKALLLTWDLSDNNPDVFDELRHYIANESWERYADRRHLRQKVWFSNKQEAIFGSFYLWDTEQAMEQEIASMHRVEDMTGVAPRVTRLDVEAVQEGIHSATDLRSIGLARADHRLPDT